MLDHYVVFKAKSDAEKSLDDVLGAFGRAIVELDCVLDFSWGANINGSGLARGFTHGCFARLESEEALKSDYWNHPAHTLLLGQLDELCEDRFALDYVVDRAGVASDE
jgi:hypothetical protein